MIKTEIMLGMGDVAVGSGHLIDNNGKKTDVASLHFNDMFWPHKIGEDVKKEPARSKIIITISSIESLEVLERAVAGCRKTLEDNKTIPSVATATV